MEEKKKGTTNKTAIIIACICGGLLFLFIVCMFIIPLLFVTSKTKKVVSRTEEIKERIEDEKSREKSIIDEPTSDENAIVYKPVIDEYKDILANGDPAAVLDKEYNYANAWFLNNYQNSNGELKLKYSFYNINKASEDEMLVALYSDEYGYTLLDIYSFDGFSITGLFKKEAGCLANRCTLNIYENGVIYFYGAGGAYEHSLEYYKISRNSKLQVINSYYVVYSRDDSDSVTIYDKETYDYKTGTGTVLDIKEDDIESTNTNGSKLIDFNSLAWDVIE